MSLLGVGPLPRTHIHQLAFASCGAVLGLALAAAAFLCASFWSFTVDDTFITLRYARNLAHGHGLTWNPGEAPAEGYTSFVWTVLMAPLHFFTHDAEYGAKAASLVATVASLLLSAGFAAAIIGSERRVLQSMGVAFVVLWQVLQLGTTVHAVSGMDTSLFTMTVVALGWCGFLVLRRPNTVHYVGFALCCLGCSLTRPEGNVFCGVLAAATWVYLDAGLRRAFAKVWLVYFVLPACGYFLWRVAYYGYLFPLPFYVKAVGTAEFLAGTREAMDFVFELAIASPAFTFLVLAGMARGPRLLRPLWWASLAVFLFFLKPVPLMAYNHRYLHPLVPLLAVAGAGGIGVVYDAARTRMGTLSSRVVTVGLVACAWLGAAVFTFRVLPVNRADKTSYASGLRRAHKELGRELFSQSQTSGMRRIALLDVGAVAYYARDWSVLDTFGLTDPTIALHGREQTSHVLASDPTFIVFVSSRPDELELVFPHERRLLEAAQAAGYRRASAREFVPDYHLVVFEK